MDKSKIERFLPRCEISEIRPCTTEGRIQMHLRVYSGSDPVSKVLDLGNLSSLMQDMKQVQNLKYSEELGVIKADFGHSNISILASGRVILKEVNNESQAQEIFETLSPLLQKSLIF